jgi:hypothetical protein
MKKKWMCSAAVLAIIDDGRPMRLRAEQRHPVWHYRCGHQVPQQPEWARDLRGKRWLDSVESLGFARQRRSWPRRQGHFPVGEWL